MIFYKIELLTVPKFLFCCSVCVNNYKNVFENKKSYLEMCVVEKGRILYENNDGTKETIMPGSFNSINSDTDCRTSAVCGEEQCHTTVGVSVEYNITKYNTSEKTDIYKLKQELENERVFLLPYHLQPDDKTYKSIISRIKKIIIYYNSYKQSDKMRGLADWYNLCAEVTDMVLSELDNFSFAFPPSAHMYAGKVQEYIFAHSKDKISAAEIAESIGISEGYMQRLFKGITGKSIVEFTNEYRIKTLTEILKAHPVSLGEAAGQVGIDDPAYMSRLFKKVMGISFTEYMKFNR